MHSQVSLPASHLINDYQELVDGIIDNLWDNILSLKGCSLVSKSWRPRAQEWLFVAVAIRSLPLCTGSPTAMMSGKLSVVPKESATVTILNRGSYQEAPSHPMAVGYVA